MEYTGKDRFVRWAIALALILMIFLGAQIPHVTIKRGVVGTLAGISILFQILVLVKTTQKRYIIEGILLLILSSVMTYFLMI